MTDKHEIVRVVRVIEYIGPRQWIEDTFARNYATPQGVKVGPSRYIRELTRSEAIESFVVGGPVEGFKTGIQEPESF